MRWSILAPSLAALVLPACILVVPAEELTKEHCPFQGDDSNCGRCLAAKCRTSIDACCSKDRCERSIELVDRCARDRDSACSELMAASSSLDEGKATLGKCVADECTDACSTLSGNSVTQCKPAFTTSKNACSCEVTQTPNDIECTSAQRDHLRCCALSGWPAPALSCQCRAIECFSTSEGCTCALTDLDDGTAPVTCPPAAHCCADGDRCRCQERACYANETEVAQCGMASLSCPKGQVEVTSCSARSTM